MIQHTVAEKYSSNGVMDQGPDVSFIADADQAGLNSQTYFLQTRRCVDFLL